MFSVSFLLRITNSTVNVLIIQPSWHVLHDFILHQNKQFMCFNAFSPSPVKSDLGLFDMFHTIGSQVFKNSGLGLLPVKTWSSLSVAWKQTNQSQTFVMANMISVWYISKLINPSAVLWSGQETILYRLVDLYKLSIYTTHLTILLTHMAVSTRISTIKCSKAIKMIVLVWCRLLPLTDRSCVSIA